MKLSSLETWQCNNKMISFSPYKQRHSEFIRCEEVWRLFAHGSEVNRQPSWFYMSWVSEVPQQVGRHFNDEITWKGPNSCTMLDKYAVYPCTYPHRWHNTETHPIQAKTWLSKLPCGSQNDANYLLSLLLFTYIIGFIYCTNKQNSINK